jgi:hypothetical protein
MLNFYEGVWVRGGVGVRDLKIEDSEWEVLCADSTALLKTNLLVSKPYYGYPDLPGFITEICVCILLSLRVNEKWPGCEIVTDSSLSSCSMGNHTKS